MIYIDRNSVPEPEIFNSIEVKIAIEKLYEFYSRSEKSRIQQKYSKPFDPQLKSVIIFSLRNLFKNKCAYCESPLNPVTSLGEIDYFRPKNNARGLDRDFSKEHYWWLTYEWRNLYYSCPNCNRYKSSWFPVEGVRSNKLTPIDQIHKEELALLIDPCLDRPEEHLIYIENGHIDFLTLKGKTTIEILKLNRIELVEQREEILKQLYSEWELFLNLWKRKNKNQKKIKIIALNWEELFLNYSLKPYVGIQRQMLAKWLASRPDIEHYFSTREYDIEKIEDRIISELRTLSDTREELSKFNTNILTKEKKEDIESYIQFDNLKHVYIEKLELFNFKCFSELLLDFKYPSTNNREDLITEPWLLFLGENGVGKSTLLKAITIALCGENYFKSLGIESIDILRYGQESGYIRLYLKGEVEPIEVKFDKNKISSSILFPKANLIAYGSFRLLPKKGRLIPEVNKFGVKALNLFDYTTSLVNVNKWLIDISKKDFDRVANALKDLMSLDSEDFIERDIHQGLVYIKKSEDNLLYISDLSDGYQSIYALAVDIMASFVKDKIYFEIAEGVVLIDEIGTHLHPRWKMEVVSQLKKTFPRIQFIVTTHEPLCLRGLNAGEVVVLRKNTTNEIIALTELPDPSELRIDQILTSDFFGLNSTFDIKTENLFKEYYEILSIDDVDRTDDQKDRLLILDEQIPKIKHLGDTLREELVYHVVDELLAKKSKSNIVLKTDELKSETINRVKSLWKMVLDNNLSND